MHKEITEVCSGFGRAMKGQKTASKMQMYFQQKRKCKIN